MIAEVSRALTAYEKLNPAGKRLFRDELGLVRPQQAKVRRKYTRKAKGATPVFESDPAVGGA